MNNENKKLNLQGFADSIGLSFKEVIKYVCRCDLSYGYTCAYHLNPELKLSKIEWGEMACDCEFGAVCQFHTLTRKTPYINALKLISEKISNMTDDELKEWLISLGFEFENNRITTMLLTKEKN